MNIIHSILMATFSFLAFMHFYWAFGGKYGLEQAIPTRNKNEKGKLPGKLITIFVGLVLLFFGSIYLIKANFISTPISKSIINISSYIIPILFFIRVIGDFKYVGLFKKVTDTVFAKADTKIYIPLCSFISVLGFLSVIIIDYL
ncbi:DUF3995 domain-containing protein [Pseudofulvibacter geojedonensis]|uniref:DUF3995 domain-containing protein n=1 Tax=Pseudofulvibacter geojedonensis TaxID=1123758 RepID=A0ABW3I3M0_9FLAO